MAFKKKVIGESGAQELFANLQSLWKIQDPRRFASYVLDREVQLADLTPAEADEVRREARAAYAPIERDEISGKEAEYAVMSNAEMIALGREWMR